MSFEKTGEGAKVREINSQDGNQEVAPHLSEKLKKYGKALGEARKNWNKPPVVSQQQEDNHNENTEWLGLR